MSEEWNVEMTTESGQSTMTTKKLKGFLEAIIVDSGEERIQVIIKSELGYTILHRHEHEKVIYYAVRQSGSTPEFGRFSLQQDLGQEKFYLNEKLQIILIGVENTSVSIKIRIS